MKERLFLSTETPWLRMGLEIPSIAFGDSMLPFVKPLSDVRIRSIPMDQIKVGDLVAFRFNGRLCVHRAVKAIAQSGRITWVTKGDNRFQVDPRVEPQGIVGIVIRVGSQDMSKPSWRFMNRIMAALSYYPLAFSTRAIARLPRGKGLATRWAKTLQPLLIVNRLADSWKLKKVGAPFPRRWQGVELRNYREEDVDSLVHLWNRCFPTESIDAPHFTTQIRQSRWFSPLGCFVAAKGSCLLGFVITGRHPQNHSTIPASGKGFIECLGVDPDQRQKGIGSLLLHQAIRYLRSERCLTYQTGYFRVSGNEQGQIHLGPELTFFGKRGFELAFAGQEFKRIPQGWDFSISQRRIWRLRERGITVRLAGLEDKVLLQEAIRQWRYPDGISFRGSEEGDNLRTFVVAIQENKVRGYCRWIFQDAIRPYPQMALLWSAVSVRGIGYVYGLYVDPHYRSLDIGAALTAKAIDTLFERGCREVRSWVAAIGLCERFRRWGFQSGGPVAAMSQRNE